MKSAGFQSWGSGAAFSGQGEEGKDDTSGSPRGLRSECEHRGRPKLLLTIDDSSYVTGTELSDPRSRECDSGPELFVSGRNTLSS